MNEPEHEPSDELDALIQLDELIERFAAEQGPEIDDARLAEMNRRLVAFAHEHSQVGETVRQLIADGAHLSMTPVDADGNVELHLGYPEDPERWPKAHGKSVPLGKYPLSRILRWAQD
jgi:hypothetical protein